MMLKKMKTARKVKMTKMIKFLMIVLLKDSMILMLILEMDSQENKTLHQIIHHIKTTTKSLITTFRNKITVKRKSLR